MDLNKEMTEREIQLEIQNQVEFKFKEFQTALKNRIQFQFMKTLMSGSHEDNAFYVALVEINKMIGKEVTMGVPWDNFKVIEDKRAKKNKCVDEMVELFEINGYRGAHRVPIQSIVKIIESAQNY